MNSTKVIDTEMIQKIIDYWKIPGLAIGVIRNGEPDEIACFGWRDQEEKLEFNEDTLFCIASCTKAMNATMIVSLAAEGILDLDEPVTTYAPELQMWDPEAREKMSLRDMLCHRTGVAGYDIMWPDPEGRETMAKRMRYLPSNKPFREVSQYSNLIYALSGYVAECASGLNWPELMKKYIFEPLGMDRTTCVAAGIESDPNHAFGYQMMENGQIEKLQFWNMDMAGPAATVNTTIKDMLKWVNFQIRGGKTEDGKQLIPTEFFKQIHQPQIAYLDPGRPDTDCYTCDGYGLGWRVGTYCGETFHKHTGKIEGYSSIQTFMPEHGLGIAILMNLHCPANSVFYPIVYSIIDSLLGLADHQWLDRFGIGAQDVPSLSEYTDCFVDQTIGVLDPQLQGTAFAAGEDAGAGGEGGGTCEGCGGTDAGCDETKFAAGCGLDAWAGTYYNPGYGKLVLSRIEGETKSCSEGQLKLQFRDQELVLHHWGANQFWLEGVKADTETRKVPVALITENNHHTVRVWYEPTYGPVGFVRE